LGLNYYGPIDGHNLPTLIETFKFAKQQNKPVVLHVLTQKGKGFAGDGASRRSSRRLGTYDPEKGATKPPRRRPTRRSSPRR
jgi:1-deoxy-D-xylulose-5-phosphate synthase